MIIERNSKFGGNLELKQEELLDLYGKEELHPLRSKNAVSKYLIKIFKPVRDYLNIL